MIKVTVHESVESALQKAFPRPAASAARALAKYVAVVESMLFDALQHGRTPEQLKLDLYAVSMEQLANKGGQIGPKRIRLHKWLRDNNLELLETVVPGSKFTGQYSQVKLSPLITMQNTLTVPSGSLATATTDEEIDAYLSGDPASNKALFDHLYPEYGQEWKEEKLAELFHWVPVDIESVKAYLYWVEMEAVQSGTEFVPVKVCTVRDDATGEMRRVDIPKRLKPWWWSGDDGKMCITVRYGARTLDVIEGKNAIETDNIAGVITTLEVLRAAVDAGELDARIEAVSGLVKAAFGKEEGVVKKGKLKLPAKPAA